MALVRDERLSHWSVCHHTLLIDDRAVTVNQAYAKFPLELSKQWPKLEYNMSVGREYIPRFIDQRKSVIKLRVVVRHRRGNDELDYKGMRAGDMVNLSVNIAIKNVC
jgi:hypothetical protein